MSRSTASRHKAEPRWHRRKDARPAEIVDAALHEFVAHGFAATRLDDIARRAGCTKGTIFLYFASKEELFKAIIVEHLLPAIHGTEARVERHEGSARELLRELVRERWDLMVNSPLSGLPKLVMAEAGQFPELVRFFYDEVIARSHAVFARVLRDGVQRGEFRPLDPAQVTRALMAPMLMAALWKHTIQPHAMKDIDPEAYFETSLDLLLTGLAAPAAGGGTR
jgi:AcrR family transcriptional regulator